MGRVVIALTLMCFDLGWFLGILVTAPEYWIQLLTASNPSWFPR